MLRKWTCGAILGGLLLVCSLNPVLVRAEEDLDAESPETAETALDRAIELSELGYEDNCKPVAEAEWKFLHDSENPRALERWEKAARDLARFKKADFSKHFSDIVTKNFQESLADESLPLGYKLSVIRYPGDALLNETDYERLVRFVGKNRALGATARYSEAGKELDREEVEYLLSHNGKAEEKLKAWATWHRLFSSQLDEFPSVLELVEKAAEANGQPDAKAYWEMLTGESDGYESFSMDSMLTELQEKLVNFTRTRLARKYDVQFADNLVPAHLLGSLTGSDWTHLAFDLAAHPGVIFDIRENLWKKKMMGKWLYKTASNLGKRLLGQTVSPSNQAESDFWNNSNFKAKCPSTLVSFCELEKIRVSTCNEPSLSNYLTAHKNVAKVLFHQMSSKFPILNDVNRYSVMEEAVAELFSILAASPAVMKKVGLMNYTVGPQEAKLTSMIITALDVLPRLAYYRSVDKWRLEALKNNVTNSTLLTSNWWKHRLQNEFTYSQGGELPTFLSDDHVVNNKPYLSKIMGIVLAFQMYEKIMDGTDIRQEPLDKSSFNRNLVFTVQNNSENWKTVINQFMKIESISTQPMSDFFGELESYYETYVENYEYDFNNKEIELEQLEKKHRKLVNTPTTTTTTTTTTTFRPIVIKSKAPKSQIKDSLLKSGEPGLHQQPNFQPPILKKSEEVERNILNDNEILTDDEFSENPKVSTSKAVWAVAAVLVATVTICIIAIFSRRRCNRTPKNRRYV